MKKKYNIKKHKDKKIKNKNNHKYFDEDYLSDIDLEPEPTEICKFLSRTNLYKASDISSINLHDEPDQDSSNNKNETAYGNSISITLPSHTITLTSNNLTMKDLFKWFSKTQNKFINPIYLNQYKGRTYLG